MWKKALAVLLHALRFVWAEIPAQKQKCFYKQAEDYNRKTIKHVSLYSSFFK
jgi:hypothetical protein